MNKRGFVRNILVFMLFLILLMVVIKVFEDDILGWLESYPLLWSIFNHMRAQVEEKSLLGLFYLTFVANLFFVAFPIEAAVAFYFTLQYPAALVLATVVAATLVGQFFNYLIGLLLGRHVFTIFFSSNVDQMESHSERWGVWMLVLFSTIPFLPMDAMTIFLGSMKYRIRKFLLWISITTTIKYLGIYLFADWVTTTLTGFIHSIPFISYFL